MKDTRVSNRAGREFGRLLIVVVLMLVPALKAGEVIFTVTGTLYGGGDGRNYFGLGKRLPEGTPFVAVATFDDKAPIVRDQACPESDSVIRGGGLSDVHSDGSRDRSAGTAVITINGRSLEVGRTATAASGVWRHFNVWCNNMPSKISITVADGIWIGMGGSPYGVFDITVEVPDMPKGATWSTPGKFTTISGTASMNSFSIKGAGSQFKVESIVVTRK
jgi:hypothetical protein